MSCSGQETVAPDVSPGLRVVSGADVADRIGAMLSYPLIVELRDAQIRPQSGVPIEFRVRGTTGPAAGTILRASETTPFARNVTTTDATGRARVFVRLGFVPGNRIAFLDRQGSCTR